MPFIYSEEWYGAMIKLANSRADVTAKLPKGEWRFAVEMVGDGKSPYVPNGDTKNCLICFLDGKIVEWNEQPGRIEGKNLNYRIIGPASVFDSIAAGITDPVMVGLDGSVTIRGDMRFLMQNTEMMNVLFNMYTQSDLTEWDKGKPPY